MVNRDAVLIVHGDCSRIRVRLCRYSVGRVSRTESERRTLSALRINYLRRFRIGARGADMDRKSEGTSEARFAAYVEGLAGVLGHADRKGPLRDYCTGLILPGERKSVEPMAARTAPARTAAQH